MSNFFSEFHNSEKFVNTKIYFVIKQKKYAYYLIPKNIVNKQKYLVYFLFSQQNKT